MIKLLGGRGRLLLLFGVLSLAAVSAGAFVSAASGVPAALWSRNLAAWGVGLLIALGIAARTPARSLAVVLWALPLGLLATLFNRGQDGVHRWVDLGPLHLNVAMLLGPAAVVALAALAGERRSAWIATVLALGLLVAQPDASQATALAGAAALIATMIIGRPGLRAAGVAVIAAPAVWSWMRPDPLLPVPEVEQILGLAWSLSPILAGVAALLLIALAGAPVVTTFAGRPPPRLAGLGLGLYFLLWAAAPFLGAFPVPFLGIGLSPIIGGWLGVGMLAAMLREQG